MNEYLTNDSSLSNLLVPFLQKPVSFSIKGRVVKKGRLLLFKKTHYFLQFSLETLKRTRENIDVPYPFDVEYYSDEELLYFDYRLKSLHVSSMPKIPEKVSSIYFDNILEIQVEQSN